MARDLLPLVRDALADRYAVEREIGRGGAARVWLGGGREERPEGDVVGAGACGTFGANELVIAGHANDRAIAKQCARGEDVAIVFAKMDAVCTDPCGECGVIVDDQRHTGTATQGAQGERLMLTQSGVGTLVAVLQTGGKWQQ